jgi:hypothetical protein
MDRRTFLKNTAATGAIAVVGGLATPAVSQRAAARALRFVPQADLSNFDPVWSTSNVVRHAARRRKPLGETPVAGWAERIRTALCRIRSQNHLQTLR